MRHGGAPLLRPLLMGRDETKSWTNLMKGLSKLGWCNELGTSTGRPMAAILEQSFDQD